MEKSLKEPLVGISGELSIVLSVNILREITGGTLRKSLEKSLEEFMKKF